MGSAKECLVYDSSEINKSIRWTVCLIISDDNDVFVPHGKTFLLSVVFTHIFIIMHFPE